MPSSRASHVKSTLLAAQCLTHTGTYLPVIAREEAFAIQVPCYNPAGENIITCQDDRRDIFLSEVNGLELDTVLLSAITLPEGYIPIFDFRTLDQAHVCDAPVIGLTLKNIFKTAVKLKAGQYVPTAISFQDADKIASLCKKKRVILFACGQDTLIEWIWASRHTCNLFDQLCRMKFAAVTGFNFSVFGGECPFAQAINQKRSLHSSKELEQNGILTIPHIYAVNEHHLARYRAWLAYNPKLNMINVNCQMQQSNTDIRQVVYVISSLLSENPELHILVQGLRFSAIPLFGSLINRVHFADAKAVKYAQSFRDLALPNLTEKSKSVKSKSRDYGELVLKNILTRSCELAMQVQYASRSTQAS